MFARVGVPCVAVAENMSSFRGDDGKVYHPFGTGAGERIAREFGVPRVVRFPIDAGLAAAGAVVYEEESLGAETWKVSLRSVGAVDTTPATKAFGGGGHANASSCNVARSVFATWRRA